MKVLIIFLSLVFMGCVTANTRDLSAINPKAESLKSEPVSNTPFKLADDDACTTSCLEDGHSPSDCSDACSDDAWRRRRSSGVENKKPLMLADDYEDCMGKCTQQASSKACHSVCERE